jgi:hypothetical protein
VRCDWLSDFSGSRCQKVIRGWIRRYSRPPQGCSNTLSKQLVWDRIRVVQYLDTIEGVEGRAPPFSHWGRSSTFLAAHPQGSQRLSRIEIDDLAQGRFKRHALWRGVGGSFGSTSVIEMGILDFARSNLSAQGGSHVADVLA